MEDWQRYEIRYLFSDDFTEPMYYLDSEKYREFFQLSMIYGKIFLYDRGFENSGGSNVGKYIKYNHKGEVINHSFIDPSSGNINRIRIAKEDFPEGPWLENHGGILRL